MAEYFNMPPMGQTSSTLKIIQWRKQEGDEVAQGDVLVEVETDKATLDVESYTSGTVLKIVRDEGELVEVGELIAVIGEPGEQVAPLAERASDSVTLATVPPDVEASATPRTPEVRAPAPGKVLAAPAARKLAADRGIELAKVSGSGPGGRITKDDVMRFTVGADIGSRGGDRTGNRSVVARRVAASFSTIPHIYLSTTVDMSVAGQVLAGARAESSNDVGSPAEPETQARITYTHLILRAVGRAVGRNERMNAVWDESGTPRKLGQANVGLVVAGGPQLSIVSVEEPGGKSLAEIASLVAASVERVQKGRLSAADVAPCAVSLSNLGMYAVDEFLAIIDPDQCAMISIGRIRDQVVAEAGAVVVRPMMSVSVAADHRVVDGTDAAQFLQEIKQNLEELRD